MDQRFIIVLLNLKIVAPRLSNDFPDNLRAVTPVGHLLSADGGAVSKDMPTKLVRPDEWIDRISLGRGPLEGERWGTLDRAGNWFESTTPWNGKTGDDSKTGEVVMIRVGKKAADRRLKGV